MKISDINSNALLHQYKINDKAAYRSKDEIKSDNYKEKVSLSSTSRDTELAKKIIENYQDVRLEKIQRLKDEIKHGSYHINEDKIAEKMINEFLLDIHSLSIDIHK